MLPAGITGYLWLKGAHPGLPGFACPLRAITGIPCPTCFLTRATAASLQAQWGEALSQHALGPLAAAALLVWSVQAIRRRRLAPRGLRPWHGAVVLAVLLGYWGLRLVMHYGMGLAAFPSG
ncbi:DUF2752 domain-containing protein [Cyanobium sp. NIES-981]|uniref:DUF2752 domain-containing protein n=1 Tax=Cyanobium sp. NIES-981 TaxID=1851505 RepID=UPI0007DDC2F8|nr:DUF2752 domain-containing protein [Cyanobium sp. NIES-981]SBO44901.1 conserved protein of unknown function [Cyanobium sp. NIES-981]